VDSDVYAQQPLSELIRLPKWNTSQSQQVVKALADSGLSVAKFSQSHGVSYWRVNNAKRRLNAKARRRKGRVTKPGLVPVTITTGTSAAIAGSERWVLEVELGGCLVRVSPAATEQVVGIALRAVRGLEC
jgi:hypothetical protein